MARTTYELGTIGESLAAEYLENSGYVILERNYRFERAEVDLIAFDRSSDNRGGEIVFVEVKLRTNKKFGEPEDAVTPSKQRQIMKAASAYLYETKMERAACRFDVISVAVKKGKPTIKHFDHAFEAE